MHLYFITRGCKHEVDRFITELQGKYFPVEYAKGKKGVVALGVRPIQLWEVVFPKPHLNTILSTIKLKLYHKWEEKFMFMFRKILKCLKIPKDIEPVMGMPIYQENIEIMPIGIKEDIFIDGIEQL